MGAGRIVMMWVCVSVQCVSLLTCYIVQQALITDVDHPQCTRCRRPTGPDTTSSLRCVLCLPTGPSKFFNPSFVLSEVYLLCVCRSSNLSVISWPFAMWSGWQSLYHHHHIRFWYLWCCGCPGLRGRQHLATPHSFSMNSCLTGLVDLLWTIVDSTSHYSLWCHSSLCLATSSNMLHFML